ncbi:MAG: cyclodeaminase/cyclohydrolase family protein [Planctomycetota bacterium]|nr:cyclodeaminase/cyclohydrolase family protein [Planctomycetota bacterium]
MSEFRAEELDRLPLGELLAHVAAKSPTPGGGAVASAVGALGAALGQMVVSYSLGKKNLAAHQPALERAAAYLTRARALLLMLATEDAQAYGRVNALSKLPEGDPQRAGLPEAERAAVEVPLAVMAAAVDLLREFDGLAPITNVQLHSDLEIAAILAEATVRAGACNVRVNARFWSDRSAAERALAQMDALMKAGAERLPVVESRCRPAASK